MITRAIHGCATLCLRALAGALLCVIVPFAAIIALAMVVLGVDMRPPSEIIVPSADGVTG